jgi:hypothetical protein
MGRGTGDAGLEVGWAGKISAVRLRKPLSWKPGYRSSK